jgi:penicillin-insensitive murein DD-endopeptidase
MVIVIAGCAAFGCTSALDKTNKPRLQSTEPKAQAPRSKSVKTAEVTVPGPRVEPPSLSRNAPGTNPSAHDQLSVDLKTPAVTPAIDSVGQLRRQSEDIHRLLALTGAASTSVGSSDDGKIIGAIPIPDFGPGFMHSTIRPPEARYGTVETVQILVRTGALIEQRCPGKPLVVNDLSGPQGGPIAQHRSHQSGRDVDLLFFYRDTDNKEVDPIGVPLDPKGWGWDFMDLVKSEDDRRMRIDLERTWCLLNALIESAGSLLHRIFIAEHLRSLLLEHAVRIGAPAAIAERFGDVTCQPSTPHDDHMHVRFFCTADDIAVGCQDMSPFYPWRKKELQAQGIDPVLAKADPNRRAKSSKRVVSAAQARLKAGPMHARVKQFLDQRESWMPTPHPGRPWCQ